MNRARIALTSLLVRSIGRLSTGISLALPEGLTSGRMLDYVYENRPSGKLLVGRLLDRAYLRNDVWEAVRERRRNVEACLALAVRDRLCGAAPVLVLDVASGPARYLQRVLGDFPDDVVQAVCWDLDARWLREGRRQARADGLANVTFHERDSLDARSFQELPRPCNVIVASGFYDWIPDDALVQESMRLIHRSLAGDGLFIFTIQSDHADLDMVNEVFPSFDGERLKMKIRRVHRVGGWAELAGFRILDTRSDERGFSTVFLARKQDTSSNHSQGRW